MDQCQWTGSIMIIMVQTRPQLRDLKASPCLEGKGDPQKVMKISDSVGENIAYKNTDKAGWRQV